MTKRRNIFRERLDANMEELRSLYMSIYNDEKAFDFFLGMLKKA